MTFVKESWPIIVAFFAANRLFQPHLIVIGNFYILLEAVRAILPDQGSILAD